MLGIGFRKASYLFWDICNTIFNLIIDVTKGKGRSNICLKLFEISNYCFFIEAWRLFCAKIAWNKKLNFFLYPNKGFNCIRWLLNFSLSYFSIRMIFTKIKMFFFLYNTKDFSLWYCLFLLCLWWWVFPLKLIFFSIINLWHKKVS